MELAPDFDEFIASLTAHGVEFVVVGAYALAFHGAPRFTGDLDILVRPSLENAARVPEYCNRGIGTTMLHGLQSEAAAAGKLLRLHVERFNPALRLYERLGFRQIDDRGVYL